MPIMSLSFRRTVYPTLYTEVIDNPNGALFVRSVGTNVLALLDTYALSYQHFRIANSKAFADGAGNILLDPDDVGGITTLADVANSPTFNGIPVTLPPMVGAANKKWYPCAYVWDNSNEGYTAALGPPRICNPSGGNWTPIYMLPLSCQLGPYKLYITGLRIDVIDADANNKITTRSINGFITGNITEVDNNPDDISSAGLATDTFTAIDCSTYHGMLIYIATLVAGAELLDISSVEIQAYYDT